LFGNEEEATDFLETMPDQFIVTEKEVDQNVYEQFLTELGRLDMQPDYAVLLRQGRELFGTTQPLSRKKRLLVQLAQSGTIEAFHLLRQYNTRPDPALEHWSRIALYECRMHLESELLGASVGLVSTGLGGEGERLRYIFVLPWQGEMPAEEQRQEIREALNMVCQQHRSFAEEIQFRGACLYVQMLVPLDVAIDEVIEAGIARLNTREEKVRQEYLATNVAVPREEEIQSFLDEL